MGHYVAGVVTKVGPRVKHFTVGDQVYARPAEQVLSNYDLVSNQSNSVQAGHSQKLGRLGLKMSLVKHPAKLARAHEKLTKPD